MGENVEGFKIPSRISVMWLRKETPLWIAGCWDWPQDLLLFQVVAVLCSKPPVCAKCWSHSTGAKSGKYGECTITFFFLHIKKVVWNLPYIVRFHRICYNSETYMSTIPALFHFFDVFIRSYDFNLLDWFRRCFLSPPLTQNVCTQQESISGPYSKSDCEQNASRSISVSPTSRIIIRKSLVFLSCMCSTIATTSY